MTDRPASTQLRQLDLTTLVLDARLEEAMTTVRELPVLAITGASGLGKSALAAQVLRRLHAEGWVVAMHGGRWLPQEFFNSLAGALEETQADVPGREQAIAVLRENGASLAKLETVETLLRQARVAVLFDDAGANLTDGGFLDPGFGEVFTRLIGAAKVGRVLLTSPHAPSGMPELAIAPLDAEASERVAAQMRGLGKLTPEERAPLLSGLCGHPRLLELANTWLLIGGDDDADALAQLQGALAPLPDDPAEALMAQIQGAVRNIANASMIAGGVSPTDLQAELSAAMPGAYDEVHLRRTTLLNLVVGTLNEVRLEALLQVAISSVPLSTELATLATTSPTLTQETFSVTEASLHRLLAMGLMAPAGDTLVIVPRFIAEGVARHQGKALADRHERAIKAHYALVSQGRSSFTNFTAITRHLAAVRGLGDLAQFALDSSTKPSLLTAALIGEVVAFFPVADARFAALIERQIATLTEVGLTRAAAMVGERRRSI